MAKKRRDEIRQRARRDPTSDAFSAAQEVEREYVQVLAEKRRKAGTSS